MGELQDKENVSINFDEVMPAKTERIKIRSEFDRIWNARENQSFINKIFMWFELRVYLCSLCLIEVFVNFCYN